MMLCHVGRVRAGIETFSTLQRFLAGVDTIMSRCKHRSTGKRIKGMVELTQFILASKGHCTHIALVGLLVCMSAFVIGEFGPLPKSLTTVSARERIVCEG